MKCYSISQERGACRDTPLLRKMGDEVAGALFYYRSMSLVRGGVRRLSYRGRGVDEVLLYMSHHGGGGGGGG